MKLPSSYDLGLTPGYDKNKLHVRMNARYETLKLSGLPSDADLLMQWNNVVRYFPTVSVRSTLRPSPFPTKNLHDIVGIRLFMTSESVPEKEYRDHWRIPVIIEESNTRETVRIHTRTLYRILTEIEKHNGKYHHFRIRFRNPYSPIVNMFDSSDKQL